MSLWMNARYVEWRFKTMITYSYYQMTDEELDDQADFVKCKVLAALADDDLISEEEAESWDRNQTLIKRKKGFFRTISDKWKKEEVEVDSSFWLVVKKV